MFRKFFAAVAALTLVVGGLFAEDVKGIFKKVDGGKITIVVDGKDKEFKVGEKFKTKAKDGDKIIANVDGDTVKSVKMDKK